jgi:uncharacterized protein
MYASMRGYKEIVQELLLAGADVNVKNDNGTTALMFASMLEHIEISRILLAAEADPNVNDDD